jgi:hypothetical protein
LAIGDRAAIAAAAALLALLLPVRAASLPRAAIWRLMARADVADE